MGKPLVSVIIPAYNAEKLILETIESVRKQSYAPIEIIVVNDGSKDGTEAVLAPLFRERRIRYITQENQGQAAARKNGFSVSKGTYISFLDADDLIAPEKIAVQVAHMEQHQKCGVCYSDIYHFWHHQPNVMLKKKLDYPSGSIFDKLILNNVIQVMTALIRRDVLERYGMPGAGFRRSDDWYLWLNLAYHGVQFCFLNRVLAFQRRQQEGTLSDQPTYFKETAETNLRVYNDYSKILSEEEKKKYNFDALVNFWRYRRAIGYVILGDKANAKMALAQFQATSGKDTLKKLFLATFIASIPTKIFGKLILLVRESKKRNSFRVVKNPEVTLPV